MEFVNQTALYSCTLVSMGFTYLAIRIVFDDVCTSNIMSLYDLFIDTPFLCQLTDLTTDVKKLHNGELTIDERYDFTICPKEIVSQFPKTYMIFGSKDIIRDECYKLADFLLSNNVSLEMKEYLYYCHGFMSISTMDTFYNPGVQQVIDYAKSVFY
jgi:acetyl esterase/lipase